MPTCTVLSLSLIFGAYLLPGVMTKATDQRIVHIHADGDTNTIATNAETVGEALKKAEVHLSSTDLVEPELNSEINVDSFHINVYRSRLVKVVDENGKSDTVMSAYQSPKLIAEDAGFAIYPEDKLNIERVRDFVKESFVGDKVTIDRAVPVKVKLDGHDADYRTHTTTVGELLIEQGIKLTGDDFVVPASDTVLKNNLEIKVVRVGHEVVTEELILDFKTKTVRDGNQPVGYKKVTQAGQKGKQLATYEIERHNGKVVKKKEISRTTNKHPRDKVVVIGTKEPVVNLSGVWHRLAMCESTNNPRAVSPSGTYRGLFQFDLSTWYSVGGAGDPINASRAEQLKRAKILQSRRGWGPWPVCSVKLGLR